jgi:hypothetical protein
MNDWGFVSDSHEPIKQALLPYRGQEITIPEWNALVQAVVEGGSEVHTGIGSLHKYEE